MDQKVPTPLTYESPINRGSEIRPHSQHGKLSCYCFAGANAMWSLGWVVDVVTGHFGGVFLILAIITCITGICLAAIGLDDRQSRKAFAIAGLVLNSLLLISPILLVLIGLALWKG